MVGGGDREGAQEEEGRAQSERRVQIEGRRRGRERRKGEMGFVRRVEGEGVGEEEMEGQACDGYRGYRRHCICCTRRSRRRPCESLLLSLIMMAFK